MNLLTGLRRGTRGDAVDAVSNRDRMGLGGLETSAKENLFRHAANEVGMVARLHGLRKAFCVCRAEKGATTHQIPALSGHCLKTLLPRGFSAASLLKSMEVAAMIGLRQIARGQLFYGFSLEAMVPPDHATRKGSSTTVRYRLFIYDRYNWDIDPGGSSKDVSISSSVEWALNEDEIAAAETLQFNSYQKYFEKSGETYTVTDALMGSLITTGDAANFDIVGAGTIHWARFDDGKSTEGGATSAAPNLVESGTER